MPAGMLSFDQGTFHGPTIAITRTLPVLRVPQGFLLLAIAITPAMRDDRFLPRLIAHVAHNAHSKANAKWSKAEGLVVCNFLQLSSGICEKLQLPNTEAIAVNKTADIENI